MPHLEEALNALTIKLSDDEIRQLEELYKPHPVWVISEELAQDGRGIKRPAERLSVFLSSLATRSRALCA